MNETGDLRDGGKASIIYQSSIGITFSGKFLVAHLVKERIAEVLTKVQYCNPVEQLDFTKVANICFKVYDHAITELHSAYGYGYETDFIIVGRCPADDHPKAFKLDTDLRTGKPSMCEVLTVYPFSYYSLGCGKQIFRERFEEKYARGNCQIHFCIPQVMREIVDDKAHALVGGKLNYGDCDKSQDFKIFSVGYHYQNSSGKICSMTSNRGVDIREIQNMGDPDELFIADDSKSPFTPKVCVPVEE